MDTGTWQACPKPWNVHTGGTIPPTQEFQREEVFPLCSWETRWDDTASLCTLGQIGLPGEWQTGGLCLAQTLSVSQGSLRWGCCLQPAVLLCRAASLLSWLHPGVGGLSGRPECCGSMKVQLCPGGGNVLRGKWFPESDLKSKMVLYK